MAYIKNPTEEQRQGWREEQQLLESQMKEMVENLARSWQENPETIAEALKFGSRMYQYSVRNNMLIYSQNPNATYVQSFKAWKDMGASVKEGEKGCKIRVRMTRIMLQIGDDLIPLSRAEKEQKARYYAGEIKGITSTHYGIGNVFDISQTTFPKEQYPRLFTMGYESALHAAIVKGLSAYSQNVLQCPVTLKDMSSIALRGEYSLDNHEIYLNKLLEDTQRLSTLSHELGHAIQHQEADMKSSVQLELEGDALGIMIESHFGIEPTETRQRHLADNYRAYEKLYQENNGLDSFGQILSNVFAAFKKEIPSIMEYVGKELDTQPMQRGMQRRAGEMMQMERESIYDRIKENISILDYASMHGYQLRRVGRYYTMQDHDSVRIDPDKNCFWRNSGIGHTTQGSVIDFAMAFVHGDDLHAALSELSPMIGSGAQGMDAARPARRRAASVETPKKALSEALPERAKNMHRAYAYLTQTRYIDQDVVQDFVNRKMLYQDVKGNCVFVSYDKAGQPVFANFRGTLSDVKFLGDVPGSDYSKGFYIDNNAGKLVVTESVIDAMSIMSILHAQGTDYKAYDYLALSGAAKQSAIHLHLAENPKEEVLLALDHDLTGVTNMKGIHDKLLDGQSGLDMREEQITYHVPSAKDWNADLVEKASRFQPLNDIPFLKPSVLPAIHYCAVQSTQHVQERGFRQRDGKEQYRLVEVKDGKIVPMDIKRNVLFRTPEEVRELIPSMYEEVSYAELQRKAQLQAGQTEVRQAAALSAEEQGPEARIKGYKVDDGCLMAIVHYKGRETEEAVSIDGERYYVATGFMQDRTYEEHDLTELDRMELEQYIKDNDLDISDLAGLVVVASVADTATKTPGSDTFLDELQKQQFSMEQDIRQEPEMSIGIGG